MKKKSIAIGMEDFKEIIDNHAYFVDKTLIIRDIIDSQAKVTLFTRPRRFGKTL
ncbi:MAG: AAA family ATPase, partial [Firmicutes bacterium]|nr:AAA family ATPase [Bacillota bacterium]